MFLQTRRDPFFDDFGFNDQFINSGFSDFFSNFNSHDDFFVSREDQLRRQLSQLHNYENRINHNMNTYQNYIDQLKKTKEQVEKKKQEITEKINKLSEEKPKEGSEMSDKKNENKIFKRVHYKTNDMEVEEQYDSQDPKNCYKIIRKAGEAPQILQGPDHRQIQDMNQTRETDTNISQGGSDHSSRFANSSSQSNQMKGNMSRGQNMQSGSMNQHQSNRGEEHHTRKEGMDMESQNLQNRGEMNQDHHLRRGADQDFRSEGIDDQSEQHKDYHIRGDDMNEQPNIEGEMTAERNPLGGDLDSKYDELSKRTGKRSNELRNLVTENRGLSVDQLYEKAEEQKLL